MQGGKKEIRERTLKPYVKRQNSAIKQTKERNLYEMVNKLTKKHVQEQTLYRVN